MAGDDAERAERSRIHAEIWESTITPAFKQSDEIFKRRHPGTPPDHLLHFTNAGALVSIVEHRTLRLSRARASNDPKELEHGILIARQEHEKAIRDESHRIFSEALLTGLGDGKENPYDPLICCFTETDRALEVAHWAMYGRDGSGFALKFKGKALNEKGVNFVDVDYNEEHQRAHMRELLELGRETSRQAANYAAGRYEGWHGWDRRSFIIAARVVGGIISFHAAAMKAPAFASEKEWRLLHAGFGDGIEAKIGIDARGPILRTYLDVHFEPDDLASIIVGPVHADLNRPVLERLLSKHGFANTTIETGTVALRTLQDR